MIFWTAEYDKNFTGIPARLGDEEIKIWERWKEEALKDARRLWFDVGLGEGRPMPEGLEENIKKMWLRNTQKRADVIIEKEKTVWIVEIRAKANSNVIGRLLTYKKLWDEETPIVKRSLMFIVTDWIDYDVQNTAEAMGIRYQVV